MGIGVGKCVGVWGRKARCGKRYERRCRKACWGVGEVREDVRKGEVGDVGKCETKCVGAPHSNTLPYISPIPLPTSLPLTLTHFPTPLPALLHSPHIFPYSSTHPNTLPYTVHLPPHHPYLFSLPTASLTSPYTPTHFPTHPMHSPTHLPTSSPQFGLCGKLTLI